MPFQEDKGSEDVPNLLSARNRGSYTMDGTADFFFFFVMPVVSINGVSSRT